MNRFFEAFVSSFLPRRCAYCGKVVSDNIHACKECEEKLPRIIAPVCLSCGREKKLCTCKNAEKYYDGIVAPFYFADNVRKGVHAFKFRGRVANADAYANEMSKTVLLNFSGIDFDFITSVPLTRKSRKARGYNQCKLLAERIGETLGIEYRDDILVKIFETDKQHRITPKYRKGNLIGVFDVPQPLMVKNKVILLCDDISTSGETLNECAKMLWLNGAEKVYCISLALTRHRKK